MVEELLQSAVANDCIRLSLVLADDIDAVRIDTKAMPSEMVYAQVEEVA